MKLNGWVRLWIVLSVVWVAFAGWLMYEDLSRTYGTTKFDVGKEGVGNGTVVFSNAQYDSQRMVEETWIPRIEAEPSKFVGKEITEPYDNYVKEHGARKMREGAALVVLPALFMLLFGWSIAWIRRGFSRPAHAQQQVPADGLAGPSGRQDSSST